MKKLTKAQVEVLEKFAVQLYETSFLSDPDLEESTCGCCAAKRKLQKKLLKALEKAGKEGK